MVVLQQGEVRRKANYTSQANFLCCETFKKAIWKIEEMWR
jgi:hypothetical protein